MHGMIDDELLNLSSAEISKRIVAPLWSVGEQHGITCAQRSICRWVILGLALLHNHIRQFGKRKRSGLQCTIQK